MSKGAHWSTDQIKGQMTLDRYVKGAHTHHWPMTAVSLLQLIPLPQSPLWHNILVQNHTELLTFWKIMSPSAQLDYYTNDIGLQKFPFSHINTKIVENIGYFQVALCTTWNWNLVAPRQIFVTQGNQVYGIIMCCWGECMMFFNSQEGNIGSGDGFNILHWWNLAPESNKLEICWSITLWGTPLDSFQGTVSLTNFYTKSNLIEISSLFDHITTILLMPWRLCCHDMCKISKWSHYQIWDGRKMNMT